MDITKCEAKTCPIKEKCFRFTSKANPFYQSYFVFDPYDYDNDDCEYFFEIKEQK